MVSLLTSLDLLLTCLGDLGLLLPLPGPLDILLLALSLHLSLDCLPDGLLDLDLLLLSLLCHDLGLGHLSLHAWGQP